MAGREKYFMVDAEDGESALYTVELFLDEWVGRDFFDGYEIDPQAVQVKDLPVFFIMEQLEKSAEKRKSLIREINDEWTGCDKRQLGWLYQRVGELLLENLCADMPYYNINTGDFTIPKGTAWAVKVSLEEVRRDEKYVQIGIGWKP